MASRILLAIAELKVDGAPYPLARGTLILERDAAGVGAWNVDVAARSLADPDSDGPVRLDITADGRRFAGQAWPHDGPGQRHRFQGTGSLDGRRPDE